MSIWPFLSVIVFFCLLVGAFLWSSSLVIVGLVLGVFLIFGVVLDLVFGSHPRFRFAFVLFLFSEGMIFLALLVSVVWFEDGNASSLSSWDDIPLTGCLFLVSSSFYASIYHACYIPNGKMEEVDRIFLEFSIYCGLLFAVLQLFEFWWCKCDLLTNAYCAACFCVVCLHFFHVVLGLLILTLICWLEHYLEFHHVEMALWYWHFVDYIWLLVFFVVYVL